MLWPPIFAVATVLTLTSAFQNATANPYAQPIIIDTDIFSDVDDLGAIAVANVLHNCGLADLRGIAINTHSRYGALTANAVCTYYGNGEIPIAIIRPLTEDTFLDTYGYTLGEFATKVAYNWPRTFDDAETTPTPLELYRKVLAVAADDSIHLISIGFLTNIADLLRSGPDDISPLTGAELVKAKVSELAIMGGSYPSGRDYNFCGSDPESAIYMVENWPKEVAITYSGSEFGRHIFSGQTLATDAPPDSPVLSAYQWYVGRCGTVRQSWDPLTVLYGVLGLDGFAELAVETPFAFANAFGYNSITSKNATNAWVNDTSVTNQHWLRLADGVTNITVSSLLNQFLTHDPNVRTCNGYDAGLRVQ